MSVACCCINLKDLKCQLMYLLCLIVVFVLKKFDTVTSHMPKEGPFIASSSFYLLSISSCLVLLSYIYLQKLCFVLTFNISSVDF